MSVRLKTSAIVLAIALSGKAGTLIAQTASLPAVLTIFPEKPGSSVYAPVFSPFCAEMLWLEGHAFDIAAQRFLPPDSTLSCLSENARRRRYGTDPEYPLYLWWEADPFDNTYYWTHEYHNDTLIIWRYNLQTARQDSFVSLYRGTELAIGKPGIWVSNHQELVLIDRQTGAVTSRAGKPQPGMAMWLRPWGEDVIVTDRWLYQRQRNQFVPFFPLPPALEGCKSPGEVHFYAEACISSVTGDSSNITYYISVPDQKPRQLPFKPDWRIKRYDLGSDAPFAWFSFPDRLVAFNCTNGDSLVYPGNTGSPLPGNQSGRFLGFHSERGLTFFDKKNCAFRRLNLPFGFEIPRHFTTDDRYIYLTYENHWAIVVQTSRLDTAFERSWILEEFEVFNREQEALQKSLPEDFYTQYKAYSALFQRYEGSKNPKIEAYWGRVGSLLGYCLLTTPDTVLEQVARDYHAGYFHPNITCEIVQALFQHHLHQHDLTAALQLLAISGNTACIEDNMQHGSYLIDILKTTQHRLDSIQQAGLPPDERLYATGRIWWDYCFVQRAVEYLINSRSRLEKPNAIFTELIKQYPDSPWADNAAYDTLFFIDYHATTTDDETPPGNDNAAYRVFKQFLKDYPGSDRRPDVLLRMANAVRRGVYDEQYHTVDKELATEYLRTIVVEYPEFAKNSSQYQESVAALNHQLWSKRWSVAVFFDREHYKAGDTIRVTIQLHNRSGTAQTLDTGFLQHWHEGLKLGLSVVQDKGCEGLWGDFPLIRASKDAMLPATTVQPGTYYAETFMLGHTSLNRNFGGGSFRLTGGHTYAYTLEFRHDTLSWFWVQAQNRGQFSVE